MDYDIVFVTNASNQRAAISRRELRLLDQIKHYGVEICETEYRHRTLARTASYFASYYVLDAIEAIAHEERLCILSDVDCIWADAQRLFQAAADEQGVGSVQLTYPLDWDVNGYSPANLAQLAERLTQSEVEVGSWIGGELLAATGPELHALMQTATALAAEAVAAGSPLKTEEQLLTLAHMLRRARFASLNCVAGRISTGPRHGAANPKRPLELGLWHLPSERVSRSVALPMDS